MAKIVAPSLSPTQPPGSTGIPIPAGPPTETSPPRPPSQAYRYRHRGQPAPSGLPVVYPNAAGLDVGAHAHYVSVPEDRDPAPVRAFGCFTNELRDLARWLKACGVDTVVLESTGVYWIPVFRVLEEEGLQPLLVDARHVKYVPGRKTDVLDCQWLRRLLTFGLLSGAFVPPEPMEALRAYARQRRDLVALLATEIQHMQKALTQMNLRLPTVLSDLSGVSGLAIVRAMVKGERDPEVLVSLVQPTVKSSRDAIVQALTGHYREEQVFLLKQALDLYDYYQTKLRECDEQLEAHLARLSAPPPPPPESPASPDPSVSVPVPVALPGPARKRSKRTRRKNEPYFDLRAELLRVTGVDLTGIDGIDQLTAFTVLSEIGFDVSAFPTVKQFCSWLGLCPNHQITGGKVKRRRTKRTKNRAADALRVAAQSLHHSDSYLGAYYRHMRGRLGAPKAITATAHKLARLIYALLKHGQAYVDQGQARLEQEHRERRLKSVVRQAKELGLDLLDPATGELWAAVP